MMCVDLQKGLSQYNTYTILENLRARRLIYCLLNSHFQTFDVTFKLNFTARTDIVLIQQSHKISKYYIAMCVQSHYEIFAPLENGMTIS